MMSAYYGNDNSVDLDRARLVALGSWNEEGQDAIAELRFYVVGVDLDRQRDYSVEAPCDALAPMHADLLSIVDRFSPGYPDGTFLRLQFQVGLIDAGQLHNRHEVMALLKDIDWGECTMPEVVSLSQSLARRASNSRCKRKSVSKGSAIVVSIAHLLFPDARNRRG